MADEKIFKNSLEGPKNQPVSASRLKEKDI